MNVKDSKEEKEISFLAKGIVELFKNNNKNYSKLNNDLKRAINILAADNKVIIKDRSQMIQVLSKPIESWYGEDAFYKNERLISNGIPTDFCYEKVIDNQDVGAEIDQSIILEVKNEFKAYGKEEDYGEFRSFIIRNPIIVKSKLDDFIVKSSRYNSKMKKIYARIFDFYEDIPNHYINNNTIEICNYCGWTIINKCLDKHCISDYCKANQGIEKSKIKPYLKEMIRAKKGVMRYLVLPGIPELSIKAKIEKLGIKVILYPNFDQYDLEVVFDDCKWALDIKDYANPYNLVNQVTEFEPNSCEKSFIVIPNKRFMLNKDYKYIINAENVKGFEYIIERDLMKKIKEKIINERL